MSLSVSYLGESKSLKLFFVRSLIRTRSPTTIGVATGGFGIPSVLFFTSLGVGQCIGDFRAEYR